MKKRTTSSAKTKKKKRPKYKGVRYIAKALQRYYPKRYPTYNSALGKAREVNAEIASKGEKVKLSSVFDVVRKKRTGSGKYVPELDENLLNPSYYFELTDYPTYIARTVKDIFFLSRISPSHLPDIQGGTMPDYGEYFAPYVNYINKMQNEQTRQDSLYSTEWMVRCTKPYWNVASKRWESKIISCDSSGNEFDYGFNPNEENQLPDSLILASQNQNQGLFGQPIDQNAADAKKTGSFNVSAEVESIRLEQQRQQNIKEAMDLLKSGAISKKDFAELLKMIKG